MNLTSAEIIDLQAWRFRKAVKDARAKEDAHAAMSLGELLAAIDEGEKP